VKPNYSVLIQWSSEDNIFVVSIPEFSDFLVMPCTHGSSYYDAANAAQEVIETFLEIWEEQGLEPPSPNLYIPGKDQLFQPCF
jgi:predicted RNase H-like HicB family nuclease